MLVHLSEDRLTGALEASNPERVPFCAELHGGGWLGGDTLLRLACDCGKWHRQVLRQKAQYRGEDRG